MTISCAQGLQEPVVEVLFADTWLNHNDFKLGSQVLSGGQEGPKVVSGTAMKPGHGQMAFIDPRAWTLMDRS